MLTAKYLKGIPEGSRATQGKSLNPAFLNDKSIANIRALNDIAERRGQTLAQMAIAWVLRDGGITTALIGASRPSQVEDCAGAVGNLDFTREELAEIDTYADEENINLWASSPSRTTRRRSIGLDPGVDFRVRKIAPRLGRTETPRRPRQPARGLDFAEHRRPAFFEAALVSRAVRAGTAPGDRPARRSDGRRWSSRRSDRRRSR